MKKMLVILSLFVMLVLITNTSLVNADSYDYASLKVTLLNQDPDPAVPGHYVELRFKVQKQGNDILKNITFMLDIDYPFSFDPGDTPIKTIGDWSGYPEDEEYYILYYKLRVDPDALEDSYTIKLKETHDDGVYTTWEFDVRVNNDKPDLVLGTLVTSPVKLVSDTDAAELDVELVNVGDRDAQNVVMQIELPEGFTETYGYSTRANLGTITAGNSKTAKFFVDIDENVNGGTHNAKITINYKEAESNDNEYKTKILYLDIPVKNKPKFKIGKIISNPRVIHPGDNVELKLVVLNIGGDEAESTSVRVFKESSQPFDFDDKTDYIGNLVPGQSGEALLKFTVDKDASPKTYLLELEVRAINGDDVITEDKTIKIMVVNGEDNNLISISNPLIVTVIALAVIITGLSGLYLIKKRKNQKQRHKKD